ncbi:MAG: hypothetical protein BMS9Abin28_0946 [Anaerolineae bacterium]|nr:MAG: hypothetical protein BMS9Abin28_0946 [Anaerolineae bacterium]
MIRELDWRDLPLLHRVRDRGLCPDSQLAFTRGAHAMQNALLGPFIPGRSAVTLVSRNGDIEAVGQCIYQSDAPNARLSFFGPEEALDHDAGLKLLESLAAAVGEHGAPNLVAEVDEHREAFERLRSAGFAIYARQRIWRLDAAKENIEHSDGDVWRVENSKDAIAAQSLYHNIVPGLVRQVEPPPTRTGHNLVYWREGELLGYLDIERGSLGTWVQPYFHPAVEDFQGLLGDYLREVPRDRPVYVCVRSYQSWMSGPLERMWFEPAVDQAVMVKRLAIGVRRQAASPLPAVEGTYPEPTAPIARIEDPAGASK